MGLVTVAYVIHYRPERSTSQHTRSEYTSGRYSWANSGYRYWNAGMQTLVMREPQ